MKLQGALGHHAGLVPSRRRGHAQVILAAKKGASPWSTGGGQKRSGGGASGGSSSKSGGGGTGGGGFKGGSTNSGSSAGGGPKGRGNGSGGGGGVKGKDSPWARDVGPAPPAKKEPATITEPLVVTLMDELTKTESAATPKWDTFCNHLGGEWVGQYSAYTPWQGLPEPAWLDDKGRYINVVYTRALEQRGPAASTSSSSPFPSNAAGQGEADGGGQQQQEEDSLLLRRIGRATTLAGLSGIRVPLFDRELPEESEVDVEALTYNAEGVVVFDGGNYSAGPEFIGRQEVKMVNDDPIDEDAGPGDGGGSAPAASAAARQAAGPASTSGRGVAGAKGDGADSDFEEMFGDEGEEGEEDGGVSSSSPTTTSVMEHCLVDWGTKTRVRLKMTLRIGVLEDNGEVDVELLRILLFREQWVGLPTAEQLPVPAASLKVLGQTCTDLPRPTPQQLQGSWNVFTICATGVDEVNPFTGEQGCVWVYSSNEERQQWDASSAAPSGADGGTFLLPGGVVLTLKMVSNYVPDDALGDSEDEGGGEAGSAGTSNSSSNGNGASHSGNGTVGVGTSGSGSGAAGAAAAAVFPRGLSVGLGWLWQEGGMVQVEREYDGYGHLREVRHSTAVKGGWSGGRM